MRKLLIEQPALAAEKTGIPGLARLPELNLPPQDSIRLNDLIVAYEKHADAGEAARRKVREAWDQRPGTR